jgi:predicted acylesterase/phospholipase RssA
MSDQRNDAVVVSNNQGDKGADVISVAADLIKPHDSLWRKVDTPSWPRKEPFHPSILVMKGGSVKGIAYVGALEVLEEYGYQFKHFVGTSAGAISASLLAVGYNSAELGQVLAKTDFKKFKDGWLPLALLMLPIRKGLYRGEAFRVWLEDLLRAKFPEFGQSIDICFSHLKSKYYGSRRLTVFASVKGSTSYSFDSQKTENADDPISFACRCSMAIPYFFWPERLRGDFAVDGGMQNNYPVYALLATDPNLKDTTDFLGLYLGEKKAARNSKWLLLNLFSIWSEAGDEAAKKEFIDRTIIIDPRPVKTTDFSLSRADTDFLLAEGRASALRWLHHWSDREQPNVETVESAEAQAAELRAKVVAERWKRFLPKLIIGALITVAILAGIIFAGYVYVYPAIKGWRCDSTAYSLAEEEFDRYKNGAADMSSLDRAIENYSQAYREDPCEVISILHNKGTALERRADEKPNAQDREEAINAYKEAIQLMESGRETDDPRSSKATLLLDLGYANVKHNDFRGARDAFSRVCSSNDVTPQQCAYANQALGQLPAEGVFDYWLREPTGTGREERISRKKFETLSECQQAQTKERARLLITGFLCQDVKPSREDLRLRCDRGSQLSCRMGEMLDVGYATNTPLGTPPAPSPKKGPKETAQTPKDELWCFWFENKDKTGVLNEMRSSEKSCKDDLAKWEYDPIVFGCHKVTKGLLKEATIACRARKDYACSWRDDVESLLEIRKNN